MYQRLSLAARLGTSLLAAAVSAQEVAYWNTQALPGALTAPVTAFGPQITIRTASVVMCYSGILHRWTTLPNTPTTAVFDQYNDHVIVRDGGTIRSWSPRTGNVVTLNVAPSATLLTGTAGRTWVAAVVDGNTVWGFASFTNTWSQLAVANATPAITLNKVTLVVEDGTQVAALSAYHGNWIVSPAATVRSVQENIALTVDSQDVVRGYSAYGNQWTTTSFAGAQTAAVANTGNTYTLLVAGSDVLGYSAARQAFATYSGGAPPALPSQGQSLEAVVFVDGATAVGFSPATAQFATLPVGGTPILRPGENRFGCFVLVDDGGVVTPYSGVRGAFGSPLSGAGNLALSDACALADAGGVTFAYSAITNLWHQAPAGTLTGRTVLYNGAVLRLATSMTGFSAREGTWHGLATTPGTIETHGSLLVSRTGTHADLFDTRLARWTTIDAAAPLQPFSVWRLMTVTHDQGNAWGFSLFAGQPDSTPILGNLVEYRANSEIGYVLTDSHIHAFSGTGSLSARYRFPEHSREPRLGAPLWLQQVAAPGSVVGSFFGLAPTFQTVPGLGTQFISTSSLLGFLNAGTVPGNGVLDLALPTPQNPILIGLPLHVQNIVVPPSGSAWLTNSTSAVLH